MNLFKFLFSKVFLFCLLGAAILVGVFTLGALQWLKTATNHDQRIQVPNVVAMSSSDALSMLENKKLRMVVLDTLDFDKNIQPFAVVEQDPKASSDVKENRTVYVKINAGGYGNVILPNFVQVTYRQVQTTIQSLGLHVGSITYRRDIAEDVVLEATQNGKVLKEGDLVKKNSKINFVLGDGKAGLSAEESDIAPPIE